MILPKFTKSAVGAFFIASIMGMTTHSFANDLVNRASVPFQKTAKLSNKYMLIPKVLRRGIKADLFIEQYINNILSYIRINGEGNKKLNAKGVDEIIRKNIQTARRSQLRTLIGYDDNFDGQVSYSEVQKKILQMHESLLSPQIKKITQLRIDRIMEHDTDKDGQISYQEMSSLNEELKQKKRQDFFVQSFLDYLKLDPNKDGELTIPELRSIAQKTFGTLDENGDDKISFEEFVKYKNAVKLKGLYNRIKYKRKPSNKS